MPTSPQEHALAAEDTPTAFINEAERALFHEAKLGEDAKDFLDSPLGKLLKGRAILEIEDAQAALLTVEPEDVATIRKLQFKAAVARQFVSWLADAVANGDQAFEQLEEMRHYHE